MASRSEFLQNLEEDGKQYAHFFSHDLHPGYYGLLIRERTPEYIYYWLPQSPISGYFLAFSLEISDLSFEDYISEVYCEKLEAPYLRLLYKIDDISSREKWIGLFKTWKQEKIRLNRVKWLEQYPWVLSTKSERF